MKTFLTLTSAIFLAVAVSSPAQQDQAESSPTPHRAKPAPREAVKPTPAMTPKPHMNPQWKQRRAPEATPMATTHPQSQQANRPNRVRPENSPAATAAPQKATPAASAPKASANKGAAQGKRPANVQAIKQQHTSFHAQANPKAAPAVSFTANRQIQGSENWQGASYVAFRDYRPVMHDRGWYRSHYTRIELIGGGYYYWNNGYWYPAWGYDPAQAYYVYDGPIYVGQRAVPPDQVIADVQAELQEMGYYKGEVDGLLGPLTREALTGYQSDNGLYTTAAIDQPTLDSLGLSQG